MSDMNAPGMIETRGFAAMIEASSCKRKLFKKVYNLNEKKYGGQMLRIHIIWIN